MPKKKVVSLAKKRQEKYALIQPGSNSIMKLTPGVRGMTFRPYEPTHDIIRWPNGYTQTLAYRLKEIQQDKIAQPSMVLDVATAFCSPKDKFSELYGREKAIDRLDQRRSLRVRIRVSDLARGVHELMVRWWAVLLKLSREECRRLGVSDTIMNLVRKILKDLD